MGEVDINKCSVYLIQVEDEYLSETKTMVKENLDLYLQYATTYAEKGVETYKNWSETIGQLDEEGVKKYLSSIFQSDNPAFVDQDFDVIFNRRLTEIKDAQIENRTVVELKK